MKLYRVVPNTFSTGQRLDEKVIPGGEDIYYKMGYASFLGQRGFHKYNNLFEKSNTIEDGKYFFLFPEDAIKQGYYLLTKFHKFTNIESFYVVEYDFPIDIVLQHFGFGNYQSDSGISNPLTEIFIEKKHFITHQKEIISPRQIPTTQIDEILLTSLTEVLKHAKTTNQDGYDRLQYEDYAIKNYYVSFEDFVSNPKNIQFELQNSRLIHAFHSLNGEIIKSPYLTGRIIPINISQIFRTYFSWEDATEYFKSMGIRYDSSMEQNKFKMEILIAAGYCNPKEKDANKIRKLLKERNYIQPN